MLVASGQPVETVRFLPDAQGAPFDPSVLPTAQVASAVSYRPDATTVPAPGPCTVREADQGTYAALIPTVFLGHLARLTVTWSWVQDGQTLTAIDDVEVTTRPVCSIADVARLSGKDARSVPTYKQLQGISTATRQFEAATNVLFSPRVAQQVYATGALAPDFLDIDPLDVVVMEPDVPAAGFTTYTYATGYASPPEDVSRAVAILASSLMTDGPWDDRGYAVSDDGGAMRLLTAGVGRAMFSIPEVEATAKRYRMPVFA